MRSRHILLGNRWQSVLLIFTTNCGRDERCADAQYYVRCHSSIPFADGCLSLLRPGKGAEYCDQPVCLCVCLSVLEHISGTAGPILMKLCAPISCGRDSVLLRLPRRCATLCTSGFMDDVTFGRNVRILEYLLQTT